MIQSVQDIGYDYNGVIILLVIKLPKMIGRYNIFKNGKKMSFKCYDNKLLKNMKSYLKILVTK